MGRSLRVVVAAAQPLPLPPPSRESCRPAVSRCQWTAAAATACFDKAKARDSREGGCAGIGSWHPLPRVLGSPGDGPIATRSPGTQLAAPEEMPMAKARKVIITCAVTGSIHTPSMSPHLPITASEIADAAIGAAEAGAAVVHLHARNPKDGRPDQSPEAFAPFLKVIKQRSNCVINITTG